MEPAGEITQLLSEASSRSPGAVERLIELVRDDLRGVAANHLRASGPRASLEPTALVHEVYLRFFERDEPPTWANRRHFYMAASRAMHDLLVERARAASRKKRGGDRTRVPLSDTPGVELEATRFLELSEALMALQQVAPDRAEVVRLRFFCGLTYDEIARALDCSERTVRRHWKVAQLWLRERLEIEPAGDDSGDQG